MASLKQEQKNYLGKIHQIEKICFQGPKFHVYDSHENLRFTVHIPFCQREDEENIYNIRDAFGEVDGEITFRKFKNFGNSCSIIFPQGASIYDKALLTGALMLIYLQDPIEL